MAWVIALMDKVKLKWRVFAYLLGFCALLIAVLWLFQTVLLNGMYKFVRRTEINQAIVLVRENINSPDLQHILEDLQSSKDILVMPTLDFEPPAGLVGDNPRFQRPESITKTQTFNLGNSQEISLTFHAITTPVDATVSTLKLQLYIITGLLLIFAIILAIVISKRISEPIEKITQGAKTLSEGKFDTQFDGHGFREITELSDTLNTAASELSKVDNLRRELMANVSHDLRTPLALIYGYAEMMHDFPDEVTSEQTQTIMNEVKHLSKLVADVLDMSSLESGMMELHPEVYNLTTSLTETIERTAELVIRNGIQLKFDYDREVPVRADEIKITQAFYNLLVNATNHSRQDKTITIRQTIHDNKVHIEVEDHGDGIAPEELPHIWTRYNKTNKSNHNLTSTGLGLSIVKRIIELHEGDCGVTSKSGVGSTFWFELNLA